MNIPNTDADIQKFIDLLYDDLGGNTWAGRGCTFACHGGSQTASGDRSYYQFARDNDIVLRQDFVRQEVTDDLDEVKTALASLSGASNYADIHRSVADIRHAIGDGGDGSADNPAKILVLVTDGVQNKWETEHGTINADDCTTIKEARPPASKSSFSI
jgi:hypothetical protein